MTKPVSYGYVGFINRLLSTRLKQRNYKAISFLYLLVLAYTAMLGGRALFFTNIFVVLWLYGRLYNKKSISLKKFIPIALILFFILSLGQVFVQVRMGQPVSISLMKIFPAILYDQGTTITVFSLIQKYESLATSYEVLYEHFFRYLYMPFSGIASSLGGDYAPYSYAESVAKYISPSSVEKGYGLGGSLMTELYLYFGWFSFFVFYAVLKLYKKISEINKVGFIFILVPLSMQEIFFSPRSYTFEFFIQTGRLAIYVVLMFLALWIVRYITAIKRDRHEW